MNAVSCVCLDPPLFLACVDKKSASCPRSRRRACSDSTSSPSTRTRCPTPSPPRATTSSPQSAEEGTLGVPLITGALAAAEFRVAQKVEAGDHVIFIGEAVSTRSEDKAPLMYFRGKNSQLQA